MMEDTRRKETHHIEAAREWLDGARASIEKADDVRGDLRVMLAKAELAHVGESEKTRRLKGVAAKVLPALAAAALAAVFLFARAETEAPKGAAVPAVQETASETQTAPPAAVPAVPAETAAAPALAVAEAQPAPPAAEGTAEAETPRPAAQAVPQPPVREAAPAAPAQPAVPEASTQKLMTTAGAVLRK